MSLPSNKADRISRNPNVAQTTTSKDLHQGIVVDNRDPHFRGAIRVQIYGLNGDFEGIDVDSLNWATPLIPANGAFWVPKLFQRVCVFFPAGDRDHPMYLGGWYGAPAGRGQLPYDSTVGPEIRFEGQHNHNLVPESIVVAMSGEGNGIWIESKYMDDAHLASALQMVDTASKLVRIRSFHLNEDCYSDLEDITGDLDGESIDKNHITRLGPELAPTDPVAGAIDLWQPALKVSLTSTADAEFAEASISNVGTGTIPSDFTQNPDVIRLRSGTSALFVGDGIFSAGDLFSPSLYTLPRKW